MLLPRVFIATFSGAVLVLGAGAAFAQSYPTKTIRIITSAAGGGSDFTARVIAQGISGPLGQQVIVENRPGGPFPGVPNSTPAFGQVGFCH